VGQKSNRERWEASDFSGSKVHLQPRIGGDELVCRNSIFAIKFQGEKKTGGGRSPENWVRNFLKGVSGGRPEVQNIETCEHWGPVACAIRNKVARASWIRESVNFGQPAAGESSLTGTRGGHAVQIPTTLRWPSSGKNCVRLRNGNDILLP